MKEIIKKRQKVFAWSYEDMLSIDRKFTEHRIPTYSSNKAKEEKVKARMGIVGQG